MKRNVKTSYFADSFKMLLGSCPLVLQCRAIRYKHQKMLLGRTHSSVYSWIFLHIILGDTV